MSRCIAFLLLAQPAFALLVQPRPAVQLQRAPPRAAGPSMQFGEPGKGLTREDEPEEFFKTNMDDMTDAEKIKSPVVIGGLALLVLPFIIGAIALQFYR